MEEPWILLESGLGDACFNMALDQALLEESRSLGCPVLRYYGWDPPAATFGYSQRWSRVATLTELRPLVRRPTGGGVVHHDHDWTYSLIFPPSHAWYRLRALASYRRVHTWVRDALRVAGVSAQLSAQAQPGTVGACFSGAEEADVLGEQGKIAGAAQRRNRQGLLIQGSIQPGVDYGRRASFESALREVGQRQWGCRWRDMDDHAKARLWGRAAHLVSEKYEREEYNQGR